MATIQVQVRIPRELVQEIDKWVLEGRFVSRSDAVKSIVAFYQERERTISFYNMLVQRSMEAKRSEDLVPLEELR